MRYLRIPSFSGIENHRQDTNKGTLRICEGAVLGAAGSLRSAPIWKEEFPLIVPPTGKHILVGQDDVFNKFSVTSTEGVIDGLKMFTNENPVPSRIGNLISLNSRSIMPGDAPTYINDVGSGRALVGNGAAVKKITDTLGAPLDVSDLDAAEKDIYQLENTPFPNCSIFILGLRKCIYAAGNPENPLTIYVSEPLSAEDPFKDGIYSSEMSKVDILGTNATKITALSTYQNYVVVHTDAGVVLLFSTETNQSSTGFRVEQVSAAANSGAINQYCCAGSAIIQPYYLGVDGEVYKDSSARRGPENKPAYSDIEQVTAKAKGLWNKAVDGSYKGSFSAYETFSGLYNFYMPSSEKSEMAGGAFQGYYYSDQLQSIVGPVLYPRFTAVTSVNDTSLLLGVSGNKLLSCDTEQMKEARSLDGPTNEMWSSVDGTDPGSDSTVEVDIEEGVFNYGGRTYKAPMADSSVGDSVLQNATYYPDAYLSVVESAYEDMQGAHMTNQIHEVLSTFQSKSYGHVWVYAENEEGKVKGGYKGSLFNRVQVKSFLNLRGRRIRLRIYIISHIEYPWVLTDQSIGFLAGKLAF